MSGEITKATASAMDAKTSQRNEFGYGPARCAYEHARIKFPDGGDEFREEFWRLLARFTDAKKAD